MYELAADLTLIVHFAFILFVVFGALFFFIETFSIVLIGDFAPHDDALKVEKS